MTQETLEKHSLAYKSPSPKTRKIAALSFRLICKVRKSNTGNSTQKRSVMAAAPKFM